MPKQSIIYTAAEVAKELKKAGLTVGAVSEADDFDGTDGEVDLPDFNASVQVGEGYLICTVEDDEETFSHSPTVQTIEQLIAYINSDLKQA